MIIQTLGTPGVGGAPPDGLAGPWGLSCSSHGRLLAVCENAGPRVSLFHRSDISSLFSFAHSLGRQAQGYECFYYPRDLVFASSDILWVGDPNNRRLVCLGVVMASDGAGIVS